MKKMKMKKMWEATFAMSSVFGLAGLTTNPVHANDTEIKAFQPIIAESQQPRKLIWDNYQQAATIIYKIDGKPNSKTILFAQNITKDNIQEAIETKFPTLRGKLNFTNYIEAQRNDAKTVAGGIKVPESFLPARITISLIPDCTTESVSDPIDHSDHFDHSDDQSVLPESVESKITNTQKLFTAIKERDYSTMIDLIEDHDIDPNAKNEDGNTALMLAIDYYYESAIDELLKYPDLDLNQQNNDGNNTLMVAIDTYDEPLIDKLFSYQGLQRIDLNQQNSKGETPLMLAIKFHNNSLIDKLFSYQGLQRIDLNQQNNKGETPLMLAIEYGYESLIDKLLKYPSLDLNQPDQDGNTPLLLAIKHYNNSLIDKLLNQQNLDLNQPDQDGNTPLLLAIKFHNNSLIDKLLNQQSLDLNQPDQDGNTPLLLAIINKNKELIDQLLNYRGTQVIDLNHKNNAGKTALTLAIDHWDKSLIDKLLNYQGIIMDLNQQNNDGNNALMLAINRSDVPLVDQILNYKGVIIDLNHQNNDGNNALMLAINRSNVQLVDQILNYQGVSIDLNHQNNDGDTALMIAIKRYQDLVIDKLLSFDDLDLNQQKNKDGKSIFDLAKGKTIILRKLVTNLYAKFMKAFQNKNLGLIKKLADSFPINLNEKNEFGETLLIIAAKNNDLNLVKLLLSLQNQQQERRVFLDDKDSNGNTALHYAIQNFNKEMIAILIDAGAYIHSKNNEGFTPFQLIQSLNANCGLGQDLPLQAEFPPKAADFLQYQTDKERTIISEIDGALQVPAGANVYIIPDSTAFSQTATDYTTTDLFPDGISYDDIKQRNVGDCYFLSTLGNIAQQQPELIKKMIKDNGDGTVTVRLYNNGKPYYYKISKKLNDQVGAFPAFLWVRLIEKAGVIHCSIFRKRTFKEIKNYNQEIQKCTQAIAIEQQRLIEAQTLKDEDKITTRKGALDGLCQIKEQLDDSFKKLMDQDLNNDQEDDSLFHQEFDISTYQFIVYGLSDLALHYLTGSTGLDHSNQTFLRKTFNHLFREGQGMGNYSNELINFHHQLQQAFASREYSMNCSFFSTGNNVFTISHVYQINGVSTRETADGKLIRTVEVRNPWGIRIPHYQMNDSGNLELVYDENYPGDSCLVDLNDFVKLATVNVLKIIPKC